MDDRLSAAETEVVAVMAVNHNYVWLQSQELFMRFVGEGEEPEAELISNDGHVIDIVFVGVAVSARVGALLAFDATHSSSLRSCEESMSAPSAQ